MTPQSRVLFFSSCAILLILASSFAGCTSSQSPAAPVATTQPPAATGGTNAITIKNFAFIPATLTVKPGTTITWTNQDTAPHIIASDKGSPVTFTSPSLANGDTYQFTFAQPGTYPYYCSIHTSMKGTIIVQP